MSDNHRVVTALICFALVVFTGVSCRNCSSKNLRAQNVAVKRSSTAPAGGGISFDEKILLSLQQDYLRSEAPERRGAKFADLASAVMLRPYHKVPTSEFELFALLGPPDYYSESIEGYRWYGYTYDRFHSKDWVYVFRVNKDGVVDSAGVNSTEAAGVRKWELYGKWPEVRNGQKG